MSRKYDYLFWDLDGTLTDPGLGITNSVMYALKKFDIEVEDRSTLYPFIGPPLMVSFPKYFGFDDEKTALAVKYYREYFGEKGKFENVVYPGIKEFLQKCVDAGCKNILATSKPEHFAMDIMEHFELKQYFDGIFGSSVTASLDTKADVIRKAFSHYGISSNDRIVMIGDRLHDIEGAHECNIPVISVLWGYGDVEEFQEYKTDYIVEDYTDLGNVLF